MSAITAIPKSNIASTIYLDKDDNVQVINGMHEGYRFGFCKRWENGYDCKRINAGKRHIQGYKRGCCGKWSSRYCTQNLRSGCSLTFPMVNGARLFIDYQDYKAAPNDIEIDSEFISYLAPKTLVMAGRVQ